MASLHEVPDRDLYCGVVAIAAVTGKSIEEIDAIIDGWKNSILYSNGGMSGMLIEGVVKELGFKVENDFRFLNTGKVRWSYLPTLGQWLRAGYADDGAAYIVPLTNHVVAVRNGEIVDNGYLFSTTPTPVTDKAVKSRKRLANAVWMRIEEA